MFTGIVAQQGSIANVEAVVDGRRLIIDLGELDGLGVGDSISVNGVCLTAVEVAPGRATVDVVLETLDRSNLGALQPGDPVNLELPMPASGRFDGHIVQGHVDGVGEVVSVVSEGEGRRMAINAPQGLMRYLVEKGSVTVDGVSLTVAALTEHGFEVALIPHSLTVTTLGLRQAGEKVNLEVDVLAKYVERLLKANE
ncbi:MAG TPA: riboflavin synthase [Acidimicrobiia bacterium]|nr:riboflavin synthase [Acidimicrobiia bacterium]